MDSVKASISRPVYNRLMAIRQRLIAEKRRNVSVSEMLEILLERAGEREDQGT